MAASWNGEHQKELSRPKKMSDFFCKLWWLDFERWAGTGHTILNAQSEVAVAKNDTCEDFGHRTLRDKGGGRSQNDLAGAVRWNRYGHVMVPGPKSPGKKEAYIKCVSWHVCRCLGFMRKDMSSVIKVKTPTGVAAHRACGFFLRRPSCQNCFASPAFAALMGRATLTPTLKDLLGIWCGRYVQGI